VAAILNFTIPRGFSAGEQYYPTAITGVTSDAPAPYKLILNSAVQLTFNFTSIDPIPAGTSLSEFALTVNGVSFSLTGATLGTRSITFSFTAASAIDRTFAFTVKNNTVSTVIPTAEVAPPSLLVRYVRITEINTSVGGVSIFGGKLGLYSSKTDADADTGTSTANKFYAGRAAATNSQIVFYHSSNGYTPPVSVFYGTASQFYGATTWAYQASSNYMQIDKYSGSTSFGNNWGQSNMIWFDLGAANAASDLGLFFRFGIMGRGNASATDIRIRFQVSADSLNWHERLLTWTESGTTYNAKTSAAFFQNGAGHTQMTPTSFALTNRTTGTPRDLSVDANRTGVTRGNRRWDAISISSHDFSNNYSQSEQWWYMFNGVRGSGGATNFNDRPNETNTIGYQLKVGGGLVYSHNVYSLNCTSLYLVTSWETSSFTHLWVVSASNDQMNWTEMATGRFSDRSENNPAKFVTWNANASDGGIAYQGAAGGSANQFYKLSWTNTQYYVYWRLGIKTAGTPLDGAFCNCGALYEIEWS
jgi:hypothetical protein